MSGGRIGFRVCFPTSLFLFTNQKATTMMKAILLTFLTSMISLACFAPGNNVMAVISPAEIIKPDRILIAHIQFESRNDRYAHNKKEDALGILQIRPIMILEVNRILQLQKKSLRFVLEDRTDPAKSVEIWYIVQNHWNPTYDLQKASRLWNSGTVRYSKSTNDYVSQIKTIYDGRT